MSETEHFQQTSLRDTAKRAEITIRTPAGFSYGFELNLNMKVHAVLERAVAHFVQAGQLSEGNYRLVDITDGSARSLTESAHLGEVGVHEGSVLALQTTDPQVDG